MKFLLFAAAVCFAMCVGFHIELAQSSPNPRVRDLGNEVRGLFRTKCAGCHDAQTGKPEGRFGYVLNLQKVAANPELVIQSKPAESELWLLIQDGEMPPADSPFGKLDAGQKQLVRDWIAAGAPPPLNTRKLREQPQIPKAIH